MRDFAYGNGAMEKMTFRLLTGRRPIPPPHPPRPCVLSLSSPHMKSLLGNVLATALPCREPVFKEEGKTEASSSFQSDKYSSVRGGGVSAEGGWRSWGQILLAGVGRGRGGWDGVFQAGLSVMEQLQKFPGEAAR